MFLLPAVSNFMLHLVRCCSSVRSLQPHPPSPNANTRQFGNNTYTARRGHRHCQEAIQLRGPVRHLQKKLPSVDWNLEVNCESPLEFEPIRDYRHPKKSELFNSTPTCTTCTTGLGKSVKTSNFFFFCRGGHSIQVFAD